MYNIEIYKRQLMEGMNKNNESNYLELLKQYWGCICELKGTADASEEISAIVKKMIFYGAISDEQKADIFECVGDLEVSVKNYSKACYAYQQAVTAYSNEIEIPVSLLEKRNHALEAAVNEKIKEAPIHWEPKRKQKKSENKKKQKATSKGEKEKTTEQIREMLSRKNVIVHINRKNISKKKCA